VPVTHEATIVTVPASPLRNCATTAAIHHAQPTCQSRICLNKKPKKYYVNSRSYILTLRNFQEYRSPQENKTRPQYYWAAM
jgi:hypothetical protein